MVNREDNSTVGPNYKYSRVLLNVMHLMGQCN